MIGTRIVKCGAAKGAYAAAPAFRCNWAGWTDEILYDAAGLPAAPLRTDRF